MNVLNTLTNKTYDNEYLFLTPTNYGIDGHFLNHLTIQYKENYNEL